jgi:hypothetical protein
MSQLSDDSIRIITDKKTGFPLIETDEIGSLTLWPITKIQFEMFMSETNRYGDFWYDEILKCNPRISFQQITKKNYEHIFMTGLHIDEALAFSKWLGEEFRIPTIEEWRTTFRLMGNQPVLKPPADMSYPADTIWKKLMKISSSPIKFSLMQDGVVDWVSQDTGYVGVGAPRDNFYQAAWNPLTDTVKKFNRDERLNYLGFRLIREGKS